MHTTTEADESKVGTYVSPTGNFERWLHGEQPEGYVTPEEWERTHPQE